MSTQDKTPVGVVGCGRMGRLHTRVYSQMPQATLVGVFDADKAAAAAVAKQFNCKAFESIEQMVKEVKAVTIATPTTTHEAMATPFIKAGVACLIEKPLAKDVEECQRLVDLAKKHGAAVQVGHVERFNPIVRSLRKLNIQPDYVEVSRISPLTFRSIDVGVVLDMMIHDIDIVLMLARNAKPVQIDSIGVRVLGDVEDVCNARVKFENGVVATLNASRLALKTDRKLRAFSTDAYVSIDYAKKTGFIAKKSDNLAAIRDAVAKIHSGEIQDLSQLNYTELVQIEQMTADEVEPLRAEQDAFLHAVVTKSRPEVNAEDGLAAVSLATEIVRQMGTKPL